MTVQPFPMIEKAIKAVIEEKLPGATGKVGGDLSYTRAQDFYVWIGLVPGGGTATEIEGQWAVDIDVFGKTYNDAMTRALALEAVLLPGRHVTSDIIFDNVFSNTTPYEGPWDDDSVFRISATYVFTARRSG